MGSSEALPLFVYGTLRPGGRHFALIAEAVVEAQPATMAGLVLWEMGSYPMATEGIGRVQGDLLTFVASQYASVLERLDRLEGVNPDAPTEQGGLYRRARRSALLPGCGRSPIEAWVYLGDPVVARRGRRIPGSIWQPADGSP